MIELRPPTVISMVADTSHRDLAVPPSSPRPGAARTSQARSLGAVVIAQAGGLLGIAPWPVRAQPGTRTTSRTCIARTWWPLARGGHGGSRGISICVQDPPQIENRSVLKPGSDYEPTTNHPDGRHDAGRDTITRDRSKVDVRLWHRRVSPKSPALHRRRKTPFYVGREPARAGT